MNDSIQSHGVKLNISPLATFYASGDSICVSNVCRDYPRRWYGPPETKGRGKVGSTMDHDVASLQRPHKALQDLVDLTALVET